MELGREVFAVSERINRGWIQRWRLYIQHNRV